MSYRYLMGMFDDEQNVLQAVRKLREADIQIHDVLSPFPIHGLDPILGLKETRLHTLGFVIGACGLTFALCFMSWITTSSWPNIFGGKPNFPLPAFIPITFEFTVLTSSIGMVVAYYLRNRLSVFKDPEIMDLRITDDRFAIVFDLDDIQGGSVSDIKEVLNSFGAVEVKEREMNEKQLSADEQSR